MDFRVWEQALQKGLRCWLLQPGLLPSLPVVAWRPLSGQQGMPPAWAPRKSCRGTGTPVKPWQESCAKGLPCPLGKGWGPERALRCGLLAASMDLSPLCKLPLVAQPPTGTGLGALPPFCHLGNGRECGLRRKLSWFHHLCGHLPKDLSTTRTQTRSQERRLASPMGSWHCLHGGHPKPVRARS